MSTATWAEMRGTSAAARTRPRLKPVGISTRASASPSTTKDATAIAIDSARRTAASHAAPTDWHQWIYPSLPCL